MASVKRQKALPLRAQVPFIFKVLGNPRQWPGTKKMTATKREWLLAAFDKWDAEQKGCAL